MKPQLGDILVEEGLIAPPQLQQAMRVALRRGSPLVVVLLEQGLIDDGQLVDALHRRLGLEVFDPNTTPVDQDAVREVPVEEANRYHLLPVEFDLVQGHRVLRVAMVDPLDKQAMEDIEYTTGATVDPLIVRHSHLPEAIRNSYRGVVTKVIHRARTVEPQGAGTLSPEEATASGHRKGRAGVAARFETHLKTPPMLPAMSREFSPRELSALVRLLLRKGLITQEELDQELRRR